MSLRLLHEKSPLQLECNMISVASESSVLYTLQLNSVGMHIIILSILNGIGRGYSRPDASERRKPALWLCCWCSTDYNTLPRIICSGRFLNNLFFYSNLTDSCAKLVEEFSLRQGSTFFVSLLLGSQAHAVVVTKPINATFCSSVEIWRAGTTHDWSLTLPQKIRRKLFSFDTSNISLKGDLDT